MLKLSPLRHDQRGLVSFVVVAMLMTITTLLTLSFAQVIRREQRQALDYRLQSQAFYAAESGINSARNIISNMSDLELATMPKKTTCAPQPGIYSPLNGLVDSANGISYSCLLIDPAPRTLDYQLDPKAGSKVFPIDATNGLANLKFNWNGSDTGCTTLASPATSPAIFESANNWTCQFSVLRVEIVPIPAEGRVSRQGLASSVFSATIVPSKSSGGADSYAVDNSIGGARNINDGVSRQGYTAIANCSATNCAYTIKDLPLLQSKYYVKVSAVYSSTSLKISGDNGISPVNFQGTQVVIDATGKAQDVLRRTQVRLPVSKATTAYPDFAIQTKDSICKQFTTGPARDNTCL